jgi:phosphinothricin acetyltransferase
MAGRIEAVLAVAPWLVSERAGRVLGYAYASAFRTRPAYRWWMESTIYLAPEARGSGLGRRLYEALMTLLRRQGFVSALGVITLPNVASVALHERLGFRPLTVLPQAGFKLGAWHDVGWWRLALCDPPAAPEPPRPPAEALPELFAGP